VKSDEDDDDDDDDVDDDDDDDDAGILMLTPSSLAISIDDARITRNSSCSRTWEENSAYVAQQRSACDTDTS
jgi:hypothetical protein